MSVQVWLLAGDGDGDGDGEAPASPTMSLKHAMLEMSGIGELVR